LAILLSLAFPGTLGAEVVMRLEDYGKLFLAHPEGINTWVDWSHEIKVGLVSAWFVDPQVIRSLDVDFDADGQPEVHFTGSIFSTRVSTRGTGQVAALPITGAQNGGSYAWPFFRGQLIGPQDLIGPLDPELVWLDDETAGGQSAMAAGANFQPANPGLLFQTFPGSPLFLGVRFQIEGRWHYGWVMAFKPGSGDAIPIAGWAYETEPDTPIVAGFDAILPAGRRFQFGGSTTVAFERADRNADGALSLSEYAASQARGSRRVHAIHRFHFLDVDRSDMVSESEFLEGKGGRLAGACTRFRAFMLADFDGDGLMQAGEWPLWYPSGDRSIRVLSSFDRMDREGEPRGALRHGTLTPAEFGISAKVLADAATRFAAADVDDSGSVDEEEWIESSDLKFSIAALKDLFRLSDLDRSGALLALEHAAADAACPLPQGPRLFRLADSDSDGFLGLGEYVATHPRSTPAAAVERAFHRLDKDRDGRLSLSEF
jgi:hypothetical protein